MPAARLLGGEGAGSMCPCRGAAFTSSLLTELLACLRVSVESKMSAKADRLSAQFRASDSCRKPGVGLLV